jgi:hypothetical protein
MVTAWSVLSAKLESDIDTQFAETVVVSPYKRAAYMGDTVPDTSRSVRNTKGYRISKYTLVKSAGGSAAFTTKRTEADLLIEIREEYIPDTITGDRVLLRGVHYDISFVEYWGNGRNVLHLLKRH